MARYLVSDLHLGHANIIEHCDRPFESVEAMNETLIDNWNGVVDAEDVVVFLGDLGAFADDAELREWLEALNGRVVFVEGNHDHPDRYVGGLNTHRYYVLSRGDREFCCTHRPENAPRFWDEDDWLFHGHHHDDTDRYPFVDPERRRVNLSVELLCYEPILEEELMRYLDRGERVGYRRAPSSRR